MLHLLRLYGQRIWQRCPAGHVRGDGAEGWRDPDDSQHPKGVVVVNGGTICESGSAAEVLEPPTDPCTTQLLADVPQLSGPAGEC